MARFVLWLHEFTDLELILAHRSRSAQGRVHFITTHTVGLSTKASGVADAMIETVSCLML
jgi:hypothetical protein